MAKQAQAQSNDDMLAQLIEQNKALMAQLEASKTAAPTVNTEDGEVKAEVRVVNGDVIIKIPKINGRSFTSFPQSASGKTRLISSAHAGFVVPEMNNLTGPDGQTYHAFLQFNLTARPGRK